MKKVAKLIIVDQDNKHLLMYRSNHPVFGDDPDLPGGTLEDGEEPIETMVREVDEEAGVAVNAEDVEMLYEGTGYSKHGTHYSLYKVSVQDIPEITISWEHMGYEWLDRQAFLEKIRDANDTYMQMVYDKLKD